VVGFKWFGDGFGLEKIFHFVCTVQHRGWRGRAKIYDMRFTIYEPKGETEAKAKAARECVRGPLILTFSPEGAKEPEHRGN
jgi:hypothetical protein